ILVGLPMKVLLGQLPVTALTPDSIALQPGAFIPLALPGTFTALDCDTGRGLTIMGKYALEQNIPNPFTPATSISYSVAARERVRLNLYDGTGTFVRTILDEVKEPGTYEFRLDAASLPSGVY